jgi:hypothetical protein
MKIFKLFKKLLINLKDKKNLIDLYQRIEIDLYIQKNITYKKYIYYLFKMKTYFITYL